MTTSKECQPNIDPLKPVHQGTSQDNRVSVQLKPSYAQVDERKIEDAMVFAKAYAKYLKFYDGNNSATGNWEAFFSRDVSVQLAIAAIQDIDCYKSNIKASFDFLNNREHKNRQPELKAHLGYLFCIIGTLARQLEQLKAELPVEIKLKSTLQNLIQNQLAPALEKLIRYHKAFPESDTIFANANPELVLFGAATTVFGDIYNFSFSADWITNNAADWNTYTSNLTADSSVYGTGTTIFDRLNHIATHSLFTAIFNQFLKVFSRVVIEAKAELEKTLGNGDKHEPHYALFLSFLKLFDYARAETNTLTQRHLDFYYRDILKLKEKPAEPGHAHLLIELAKHVDAHEIKAGELFKAGKDDSGIDVFFANDRDFVANQAKVTELKSFYRHKYNSKTQDESLALQDNRLFASPVANSTDGLGAKPTSIDQSWQPFSNKTYANGKLIHINMPQAEVGFGIASHYLWLAEGERIITVEFTVTGATGAFDFTNEIACFVTTEKGWFKKMATEFSKPKADSTSPLVVLTLKVTLLGADPAITPYLAKTHGYQFKTDLPILLVKLTHNDETRFIYASLETILVQQVKVSVEVTDLKTLAVSNDFGPVDSSKPFQPFGAMPVANSAFVIGSKEAFQKTLTKAVINTKWQNPPSPYNNKLIKTTIKLLQEGKWEPVYQQPKWVQINGQTHQIFDNITNESFTFIPLLYVYLTKDAAPDFTPDFSAAELYNTNSRQGFVRLSIDTDLGQSDYEKALLAYIKSVIDTNTTNDLEKPTPPIGPFIAELTLDYTTTEQIISLNNSPSDFEKRQAQFFHLTPFGQCEEHSVLTLAKKVFLVPQFNNAEFYIGITGLKPPQNLALLFQVANGTADPLLTNPNIQWSYLGNNEWINFNKYDIQDSTDGLLNSGIITFAIPDKATATNTLLPAGQYWLRATVTDNSDAVCKLLTVSTQALKVTFQNQNNSPSFQAETLPADTIGKLKQTDAAVKKVTQPFAGFGGRTAEQPLAFYTRISERLRHKDRAVTLWDYEHLILETFPQIYQVKCLNHTHYEPDDSGSRTYHEMAPGHVTVVTIPNQYNHNLHNPLRPYTSVGLLKEIELFLQKKLSCFINLHVRNPQFEEVSVAFKVKFYSGLDESFHVRKLQEAITRFLSPWAFSEVSSPTFGGKIYQSVVLNFVEEQAYVDYVIDFQLFQHVTTNGELKKLPKTELEGTKAVSILVSVPADDHDITLSPAETQHTVTTCPCASQ